MKPRSGWGRKENACKNVVGNSDRKRLLGRFSLRWRDDIKIDLGFEDVDCMNW
jgi:hypothetical protein